VISEKDKALIRRAQEVARGRKQKAESITCPFNWAKGLGDNMSVVCNICFKWCGLEWDGRFFHHPCSYLSEEQIKERFWKNPGT